MCDLPKNSRVFRNPDHKSNTLDRIYKLYEQRRYYDVEIVLNDQRYQVHSVVISAVSEYLNLKLFDNVGTPSLKVIPINNLDNDATQRAIEYCYTGEIEFSYETVLKVLTVAGLFQLESLVEACCNFMSDIIDTTNCLEFHETANLYGCTALGDKVINFILRNYKMIAQTNQFLDISVDKLQRLLRMNLNVSSEIEIFDSVKTWVSHDMPNRKIHLPSLLKLINLPMLPDNLLYGEVTTLCEGVQNCPNLIISALQWKHSPHTIINSDVNWNKSRTRISTIILAGSLTDEGVSKVEIFNPNDNAWLEFLDTNIARKNANYVLVGDELIAIGGEDNKIRNTVESIDLKTGKKINLPSLQIGRVGSVAAAIGNVIYVFGGNDGSTTVNSAEKWDPVTRKWSFTTPMITGRRGCGITVLDNEIYVIGGWNESAIDDFGYKNVEVFCPCSEKWRTCAPMNESRHWISATTYDGKIYVFGGRQKGEVDSQKLKSVECYNKSTDSWSFIADMSTSGYGVASGVLGNNLVIIGGATSDWKRKGVEKYSKNLNKWSSLPSVREKRENSYIFSVPTSWLDRKLSLN
ncbi:kelch-like protein 15 [Arctopsyche grandis]|uniref:kelch-like protein 15 n=1 Tax=Arctopsyche grandis TaxID=121162 RepID=UPI00406D771A